MIRSLLERQFLMVLGKGGVGKSTCSLALALAARVLGKKVLLAMAHPRPRLSSMLEVDAIGPHNTTVLPGLDAVNIEAEAAIEEYALMLLRLRALYRIVFKNRYVQSFLQGTPGLAAWTILGKSTFHVEERGPGGTPRYDLVILDAPATGHGLELLHVPEVIASVAPPSVLRRDAERALRIVRDPARSAVVAVSLPQEMPVSETLQLDRALQRDLGLKLGAVFFNRVLAELFTDAQRTTILDRPARFGALVCRRVQAEREQKRALQRLRDSLRVPITALPWQPGGYETRTALSGLAQSWLAL